MNSTTNPLIAAVASLSGEMLALEPQSQHTSGMTVASIRRLIADDSHACTFQSFGQYRTALLKAIDRTMPQSPSSSSSSEAERDALLPCPFCGGAAHFYTVQEGDDAGGRCVVCSQCNASSLLCFPLMDGVDQKLLEHWNARATPPSLPIDFKQASELLSMFGGEAGEVTLRVTDGHSGKGLYAHYTEYPEEGAEFLGATDGWAVPTSPSPHPEEGALLLGGDEGGKKGGGA